MLLPVNRRCCQFQLVVHLPVDEFVTEIELQTSSSNKNTEKLVSIQGLTESLRKAKPPMPTKARGRPKGTKNYKCSGTMSKLPSRVQTTVRLAIKNTVDFDAIQQRTYKITENDLNEQLQLAALQVSWGRLRHFFTPSAYDTLQANLKVLRSVVNTCQICMIPYNGEARPSADIGTISNV